jgi:hypothetical protein
MSSQQVALDAVPSGHPSGAVPNKDVHLAALSGRLLHLQDIFPRLTKNGTDSAPA